ncbi:MAG: hypothetical protein MUF64_32170, partial [Polyangiaceae bacterium]|nr:hypothetical protein [Polyangiaceae bacterium]
YECGFSGPDPSFQAPIACPLGLNEGDPCGKITGTGCCDDEGGVWYCSDADGQEALAREVCIP